MLRKFAVVLQFEINLHYFKHDKLFTEKLINIDSFGLSYHLGY